MKIADPEQLVFIGMDYGKADSTGKIHDGHALRVDKVIPNSKSPGGYDFVLVNPWNSQKRETYSLSDIRERGQDFRIFNSSPQKLLMHYLLGFTPAAISFVCENSKVLSEILQIEEMDVLHIDSLVEGIIQGKIKLIEIAQKLIDRGVVQPKMKQLKEELEASDKNKFHLFIEKNNFRIQKLREVIEFADKSRFIESLALIKKELSKIEQLAQEDNKYNKTFQVANQLYTQLLQAKECLLHIETPIDERLAQFQKSCLDAIHTALPILGQEVEWQPLLIKLVNVIVALATVGLVCLATGRFGLFKPQKKILPLEEILPLKETLGQTAQKLQQGVDANNDVAKLILSRRSA